MPSDLDKDCLAQGSPWGFRVPVVVLRHSVTGINPKAKLVDVFLPASVAGVRKHTLKDSEVAHLRTLSRDGPRVMPSCAPEGMFKLQCCRTRGPALALQASGWPELLPHREESPCSSLRQH